MASGVDEYSLEQMSPEVEPGGLKPPQSLMHRDTRNSLQSLSQNREAGIDAGESNHNSRGSKRSLRKTDHSAATDTGLLGSSAAPQRPKQRAARRRGMGGGMNLESEWPKEVISISGGLPTD